MHIPIPIGVKRVAAVHGAVWKFVSCEHCEHRFAYLLELEATGEDHDLLFLDAEGSAERAQVQAEQNFLQKSRNVVLPVPCPNCGFYQADMSQILKEEKSINSLQIAGCVITVLSIVPWALDIPHLWGLSIVLAVAGIALLAYGYVIAFRFDPNAGDPEPRKALGITCTVSGEQLAELLAANPGAGPEAAHDRDGSSI